MRILSSLTLASTFLLAISGCGSAERFAPGAASATQSLDSQNGDIMAAASSSPTFTQVQSNIFNAVCVKCHSGATPKGKVDLSSYASIMANKGLIVPGDAAKSLIYTEIVSGKMPDKGLPVSASDQTLLYDWINAGALNN